MVYFGMDIEKLEKVSECLEHHLFDCEDNKRSLNSRYSELMSCNADHNREMVTINRIRMNNQNTIDELRALIPQINTKIRAYKSSIAKEGNKNDSNSNSSNTNNALVFNYLKNYSDLR